MRLHCWLAELAAKQRVSGAHKDEAVGQRVKEGKRERERGEKKGKDGRRNNQG